ncbi:MAG: DUF4339 domain-containing protein [Polyangiaceae bacterium]|nr:DUF4339 domain-containing protein [Polyangiaceae bacterium]
MSEWMVRTLGSEGSGPYTTEQIVEAVDNGELGVEIEVCHLGQDRWLPIEMVPEFAELAFFDGETNVLDSPYLASQQGTSPMGAWSQPRPAAGTATDSAPFDFPTLDEDLDLATEVRAPPSELLEQTIERPPPSITNVSPLPSVPRTAPYPAALEAAHPSPLPGAGTLDDLDQTMTRVAPQAQQQHAPGPLRTGGVLPTLTMERDLLPIPPEPPAPAYAPQSPPFAAQPNPYSPPPAQPGPPHFIPGPMPYDPNASAPQSDVGVKALIALIIVLAVALTVVLALLATQ